MVIEDRIKQKLQSAFQIELLELVNESSQHQAPDGAETHFRVLIVSRDFEGLGTIQRHRKVHQVLKEELNGPVHAFSQKTFTPSEWQSLEPNPQASPPCHKKF